MKLRNKETGEIGTYLYFNPKHYGLGYYSVMLDKNPLTVIEYGHNIDQLYQEWDILGEDYEEPKEKWFITEGGNVIGYPSEAKNEGEKIGNDFSTKEEAEEAVEKLKAITRLSKCGFKFEGYDDRDRANGGDIVIYAHIDIPNNNLLEEAQPAMLKDLDLLFAGGEE